MAICTNLEHGAGWAWAWGGWAGEGVRDFDPEFGYGLDSVGWFGLCVWFFFCFQYKKWMRTNEVPNDNVLVVVVVVVVVVAVIISANISPKMSWILTGTN